MESQNNIGTCSINDIIFNLVKSHADRNIIKVSSKREVFFDVFECVLTGGQTLVFEKVGESVTDMLPIVNVEFIQDSRVYTCEAILIEDNYQEFIINEDNIFFSRYVPVVVEDINITDTHDITGIEVDAEDLYQPNIQVTYEDQKNSFIQLLDEQLNLKLASLKEDFSTQLETFLDKVTGGSSQLIEGKLIEINTTVEHKFQTLKEDIKHIEDFSKQNITETIKKKIAEIEGFFNVYLENLDNKHDLEESKNLTRINNNLLKINTVKASIEKSNSSIDKLQHKIKVLEDLKSNIITLDDIKEKFIDEDRVQEESKNIIKFVTEKILELSDNIQANSKEQEKKYDSLVNSISVKDVDEFKTIIHDKINEAQIDQLRESLQSDIEKSLKVDIMSLKRYVEMSSGGGSVAQQFANGGNMNGNLTVVGTISASQYLGIPIYTDTDTLSTVTGRGNTTTDSITVGGVNTPSQTLDVVGNIAVSGTVDGVDIAALSITVGLNTDSRHTAVTVVDSSEINFTLTGQQISATIIAGSIDEAKLDASVNTSLDLADSALQSYTETQTLDDVTDLGATTTNAITVGALTTTGAVSIGTNLEVGGHFSAATKSFLIDNPNGGKLQYGVIEGREHAVYYRGKTDKSIIELPKEWEWLVHEDSVTAQVTPIGKFRGLYVISQDNKFVQIGGVEGEYNYVVYGTRKDVEALGVDI